MLNNRSFAPNSKLNSMPQRRTLLLLVSVLVSAFAIGLATIYQPFLGLAIVLVLLLGLGVAIKPDIASLAVFFILYTNAAAVAVRFHGVPSIVGALFLTLLFIPLGYYLILKRQPFVFTPIAPLLVVYLLIQMAGVIFSSENMDLAFPNLITYITEGMLLFLLITNVVRTPAMLRQVIWVLLAAGVFMGSLSLFQYVTNTLDNNYGGFAQNEEQTVVDATAAIDDVPALVRQAGPIGEKNRYSQIMLMLVPLGMFRFWGERSKVLKVAAAGATVFCLIGSLLTFSRGGIVGLILMLLIMAVLRYIKLRDILLVIAAMVLVVVMFPQNLERLSSLEALTAIFDSDTTAGIKQTDGAVQGRATEMIAAGLVFIDHPLVGVGPGMFPYYVEQYARGLGIRLLTTNREAHSLYLGTAAEVGGLGLLCFLGMVGISMVYLARGHKRWQKSRPDIANLNASFMFVLVVYMTTGLFLHMSYERYFWSMLALANVAIYLSLHATEVQVTESTAAGGALPAAPVHAG